MRNLFVCHSQAQLILATSLTLGRFHSDKNHLILFLDFNITDNLRNIITKVFDEVLFRTGTHPAYNKKWGKKIKRYPADIRAIRTFMDKPYNRIFEVCDGCLPEMYIFKIGCRANRNVECIWLEDGSYPYFRNIVQQDGFNSNKYSRYIHRLLFKYLFGLRKFYDVDFAEMGGSCCIKQAYITFPGKEREPYKSKREIIGITDEEYIQGIRTLYPPISSIPDMSNSILLVLDKLDVYKDKELVRTSLASIIEKAIKMNARIYCKFHPREEEMWDIFSSCISLDKNIGIEGYYSSLASVSKTIKIIGIKSTGLQIAKKMGFDVVSLASICKEENKDIDDFYASIGIKMPVELQDVI